jgi:hypothetical protein
MLFDYEGGEKAVLTSSFESSSNNETELCFEHGFIKFERDPEYPIIFGKNGKRETIDFDYSQGEGYELEAEHVMDCMDKGLTESPILSFQFSRDLMEIMDRVRKEAGIVFPKHD